MAEKKSNSKLVASRNANKIDDHSPANDTPDKWLDLMERTETSSLKLDIKMYLIGFEYSCRKLVKDTEVRSIIHGDELSELEDARLSLESGLISFMTHGNTSEVRQASENYKIIYYETIDEIRRFHAEALRLIDGQPISYQKDDCISKFSSKKYVDALLWETHVRNCDIRNKHIEELFSFEAAQVRIDAQHDHSISPPMERLVAAKNKALVRLTSEVPKDFQWTTSGRFVNYNNKSVNRTAEEINAEFNRTIGIISKEYLDPKLHKNERDRFLELEEFAKRHGGEGVAEYARHLFPEVIASVESAPAPATRQDPEQDHSASQPKRWVDRVERSRGQNPIPFLREQYAAQLEKGMSIGQLRVADPGLGSVVMRWAERHGLPADLNLDMRTRQQRNDDQLADIESAKTGGRKLLFSEREAQRIASARHRRREQG